MLRQYLHSVNSALVTPLSGSGRLFARSLLTAASMNPAVRDMQYAVRGAIVTRADALASELKKPNHKLPFSEIIYCNIGNPQQLNQPPITFFRRVKFASGARMRMRLQSVVDACSPC